MRIALACMVLALAACAGDFDVDKQTYPCRAPGDCVEGFVCHPTRYVCVPAGDGGPGLDAGSPRG